MNSTNCMDAPKKAPSYFAGICSIIESCGRNGVLEIHFDDVSLFRTEAGQFLPQSRKKLDEVKVTERPEILTKKTISDEKRALLDEQRRIVQDELENLDLEDPVMADRLSREAVEKEI